MIKLTSSDWNIMECLWEKSPLIGRDVVKSMEEKMGWTRSTTLTLLSRLEAKGAVSCDSEGAKRLYAPAISREDAALQETEDLLGRIYQGSLSMMVSAFTKKKALSKEEIEELQAILNEMEEETDD